MTTTSNYESTSLFKQLEERAARLDTSRETLKNGFDKLNHLRVEASKIYDQCTHKEIFKRRFEELQEVLNKKDTFFSKTLYLMHIESHLKQAEDRLESFKTLEFPLYEGSWENLRTKISSYLTWAEDLIKVVDLAHCLFTVIVQHSKEIGNLKQRLSEVKERKEAIVLAIRTYSSLAETHKFLFCSEKPELSVTTMEEVWRNFRAFHQFKKHLGKSQQEAFDSLFREINKLNQELNCRALPEKKRTELTKLINLINKEKQNMILESQIHSELIFRKNWPSKRIDEFCGSAEILGLNLVKEPVYILERTGGYSVRTNAYFKTYLLNTLKSLRDTHSICLGEKRSESEILENVIRKQKLMIRESQEHPKSTFEENWPLKRINEFCSLCLSLIKEDCPSRSLLLERLACLQKAHSICLAGTSTRRFPSEPLNFSSGFVDYALLFAD